MSFVQGFTKTAVSKKFIYRHAISGLAKRISKKPAGATGATGLAGAAYLHKNKEQPHKEQIPGGLSSGHNPEEFNKKQIAMGKKVESEHTKNKSMATEIAMDHLMEDPVYYTKLKKMEKKSSFIRSFVRE